MCGRIASNISGVEQILQYFGLERLAVTYQPRYNIAPGQQVFAIIQNRHGKRYATYLRWGLLPSWAKDPQLSYKMINARAETADQKPTYRNALRLRRCLIPATGFYEWCQVDALKTPYFIRLLSSAPMALAGLWEEWQAPKGETIRSFTVLTTAANHLVSSIHNRMPVVIPKCSINTWLDHSNYDLPQLMNMMQPYPAEDMEAYPVSTIVNSPINDRPECIRPIS